MLHNFSFVIEDRLAGCAHPGVVNGLEESLEEMKDLGIGAVVSLDERGVPAYVLAEHGVRHLHLPIEDFGSPTFDQAERFVDFARREIAGGTAVVVHCRAGYGRTGTMLACYLVAEGEAADRAIHRVRRLRPGSIETEEQERFIFDFERHTQHSAR
jgi:atypical dual specificity phosphatase